MTPSMSTSAPEEALQGLLDGLVAREGAPGALLRVEGPGFAWAGAAGRFAPGGDRLLAPGDAFRIASVTKTVTALTAVRLDGRGVLDLDLGIGAYLPGELLDPLHEPGVARALTVRGLLDHTNGLYDHISDEAFLAALLADPGRRWDPREFVAWSAAHGRPWFRPGEGWRYGDLGYVLAGLVIEAVTGGPLQRAYRAEVLDPLGMADTHLEGHEDPRGPASAAPAAGPGISHPVFGELDLMAVDPTFDWAGGGLVSTAADLARLVRGLPAALQDWRDVEDPRYDAYGLGLGRSRVEGTTLVGHTGAWGAFAYGWPEGDAVVTGTVNRYGIDRLPVLAAAVRALRA